MAYIARTDGTLEAIDPKTLTLERAQEIVGGYVERARAAKPHKLYLLVDEEGKLKGKPINAHACMLYGTPLHGVAIVGDVIVLSLTEARRWS